MWSIILASAAIVLCTLLLQRLLKKDHSGKHVPAGSFGLPFAGETLSFLRAQTQDRVEEWVGKRVSKYGPVFKTSLVGCPTVIVTGQAGSKFVLGSRNDVLTPEQPKSVRAIAGKYNLFDLPKERYLVFKEAMISFLKAESLQHHVKHMDSLVVSRLLKETKHKDIIKAVDLMKMITFDVSCTVLFGVYDEPAKQSLLRDIATAFRAYWSMPIDFPGTTFRKGLDARKRIVAAMLPIIRKKKEDLKNGIVNSKTDMISCLLSLGGQNGEPAVDMEIVDNFIMLMIASHDTSAMVTSLVIWKLSKEKEVYRKVREEQMGIIKERGEGGENVTWGEIQKMKYTWRVTQEVMRMTPILSFTFRKVVKDTSFAGYDIPKGWQVASPACGTHMDKGIFENPTKFDPNRFDAPSKPIPPYSYVPFGGGAYMCIGNEFGRVEVLTIIHHLVTKFEWTPVYPDEKITRDMVPYPSLGLPIKLKPIM